MHLSMLEWLRCPFCGTTLTLVDTSPIVRNGDDIDGGVLGCECCAYPVIAGIPVLIADETTRTAMHQFEAGDSSAALLTLLGLDGERAAAFQAERARPGAMTYRSAVSLLSPDPEGTYFLYRFSDPTFVFAESLLRTVERSIPPGGRALDLCGGSGHLTRVLAASGRHSDVVLADVFFWKLWLAQTFTVPGCLPICCDANNPLPFTRHSFGLVTLSDAFPYIWHKRLLADEMIRLVEPTGVIVMPHLHSSLGENFSPGMPLTPASYRNLFEEMEPRLFSDRALLDDVLGHSVVDLTASRSPEALGTEPSFTLIAARRAALFKRVPLGPLEPVSGELRVNPLYQVEFAGGESVCTLAFPSDGYEEEFGDCRRYMPDIITLSGDVRGRVDPARLGAEAERLRRLRVLIDVPGGYL